MNILALELDGKMPNHAIMRIAAHHKAKGDSVDIRRAATLQAIEGSLFDQYDLVYASAIFERSRPLLRRIQEIYPGAWDSTRDETILFKNLRALTRYGMNPDHLMVYMLLGDTPEGDWLYRRQALRDFGSRPYPMPLHRTPQTAGFQRWVVGAYDKRIAWQDWKENHFRPEGLGGGSEPLFE